MTVDIARVQARLLEMAKQVTTILEKNNIPYMISYGTLLGAIRHQGFIPWDDDFDIFLFDDENYEKSRFILRKNLSSDLFLEDEETEKKYYHAWSRVKCNKTQKHSTIYPLENTYKNQGLSIDLFKLKKIKEINFIEYVNKEFFIYINRLKNNNLISEEVFQKKLNSPRFYPEEVTSSDEKEIYAAIVMNLKYEFQDIHPLKKYKFEDTFFYGPNNYHNILEATYGSYMEIPPKEKRKTHYNSVVFFK